MQKIQTITKWLSPVLIAVLFVTLYPNTTHAAIAFDVRSIGACSTACGATLTVSLTQGAIANGAVVVNIGLPTIGTVSGVTFNGVAMTLVNSQACTSCSTQTTVLQYVVATGATTGAHNAVASISGLGSGNSNQIQMEVLSFSGVNQITPVDTQNTGVFTSGTTNTVNLTTTQTGDQIVDAVIDNKTSSITKGASQTLMSNALIAGANTNNFSTSRYTAVTGAPGTYADTWTDASTMSMATAVLALQPPSSGPTPTSHASVTFTGGQTIFTGGITIIQ